MRWTVLCLLLLTSASAAADDHHECWWGFDDCRLECPNGGEMVVDDILLSKSCEKNGKKHGQMLIWYSNDRHQLWMSEEYKHDKLHGRSTIWSPAVRDYKGVIKDGQYVTSDQEFRDGVCVHEFDKEGEVLPGPCSADEKNLFLGDPDEAFDKFEKNHGQKEKEP